MNDLVFIGVLAGAGVLSFLLMFVLIKAIIENRNIKREKEEQDKANGVITEKKESMLARLISEFKRGNFSKKGKITLLTISLIVFIVFFALTSFVGLFISGLLAGLIYLIPNMILKKRKAKFIEDFNSALVDSLEVISNAMRAGNSLGQALSVAAQEGDEPIASELKEVVRKNNMGQSFSVALEQFMGKYPESKELRMAITSINISLEVGGNLAKILEKISSTMKQRKKITDKIGAMTAQGMMSAYVAGSAPFIMLGIMYMTQPDMVTVMFNTLIGNVLLLVVVGLVSLGIKMIKKISTVKV
jgi:tight adherence protein B